jgi:K+-transporting ATPase ATPase C chain
MFDSTVVQGRPTSNGVRRWYNMKKILLSLRAYVIFTVLLGLVYPLTVTLIAQLLLPYQANGSLILKDGAVIGSKLIGQRFTDLKYFQSRASANDYNAASSGATNLGPSSGKLKENVSERITRVRQENALGPDTRIPADMVLASASGLDPHISLENALLQAGRISKIRNIPIKKLQKIISDNTDPDFVGIWGCQGINVLKLNLFLDDFEKGLK